MRPQEKIINYMKFKQKYLPDGYFTSAMEADIMTWDTAKAERVVDKLINFMSSIDLDDESVLNNYACPYCVYMQDACVNCFYAKVNGNCYRKESFFQKMINKVDQNELQKNFNFARAISILEGAKND